MGPETKKTLMVTGDLAPLNRPEKLLAAGHVKEVFGRIGDVFKSADAVIANLECPLTTSNIKLSKAGPNLKALPEVGPAIAKAGISAVSLANNHIFDYGLAGLDQTRSVLDDNGIAYSGMGENAATASAPFYLDLNGFTLGMLSYAEHEFNWTGDDTWCTAMLEPAVNVLQIQQTVKRCAALVVLLHAGPENWHFPPPRMVRLCRAFAEAGAAAVLVSHSHTIMGREYHNGVPIVYGLGNFLFDAGPNKNIGWRLGQMAKISFDDGGLVDFELIPVLADAATGCTDLLPEKFMPVFHRFLDALSEPLQDMSKVEELWKMFCASQTPHLAKECTKAALAMAPGMLLHPGWCKKKKQTSYYVKGANIYRGLLMCENHQDVLGRIFDLIRIQQFHEYRSKAVYQQSLINQYYQEFSNQ